MAKDYYEALGVSESATADDIKRAFRGLAKKYHPDRNKGDKGAEAKFKEISEAYETLSDPKKREQYDMMRKYGAFQGAGGAHPGFGGGQANFDFNDLFGAGGGGQGGGFQFFRSGGTQGMDGLEDILSSFFGGRPEGDPFQRARRNRRYHRRGADLRATIQISFMESVHGTEKRITLKDTGKQLKVKIPAGIEDGKKIRLVGQGRPGFQGRQHGDLLITVKVMPDQQFERKGNDVYTNVTISFKDAILGTKVNVKTLSKTIALTVPAGTQPGTKMRLKGLGLAVGGQTGDQFVTINVEIPTKLTDKQKELLESWDS